MFRRPSFVHSLLLMSGVCLYLFNTPGHAQQPSLMDRLDVNKDGVLTLEEFPPAFQESFPAFDLNQDGKITMEEGQKVLRQQQARRKQMEAKQTEEQKTAEQPGRNRRQQPAQRGRANLRNIELIENLDYIGDGNRRQMLDLLLPEERATEDPLPVIVFIHGGGWQGGNKESAHGRLSTYVRSGHYAAASFGYRLTNETHWPSQLHDCQAALRWLKAHAKKYNLDADKIGIMGASAGGHLVALLGTSQDAPELTGKLGPYIDQSVTVQCVVDFCGPANFVPFVEGIIKSGRPSTPDNALTKFFGGPIEEKMDVAKEASPQTYITAADPPIMIVHGTKDHLVPFDQSVQFHAALKDAGIETYLITNEGGGHGNAVTPELQEMLTNFFDKHLRGKEVQLESKTFQVSN
ncbi:Carboxylesterase type B [Planctomycetales bacterium 10988]|nr:Carboxylesterase type B [Planctomycetales bacterium 10988]